MKFDNVFSFRDFVNYYFPGVIWSLNIILVVLFANGELGLQNSLDAIGKYFESVNLLLAGVLGIVIPYIIGFILLPIGEGAVKLWKGRKNSRRLFPNPAIGLFYGFYDKKFEGLRFSEKETKTIFNSLKRVLKLDYSFHINLYLFPTRAYVLEHGGKSAALAVRARDLMNFTESLSVSVPLNIFLVCLHLICNGKICNESVFWLSSSHF
jgi:hypothetical protein